MVKYSCINRINSRGAAINSPRPDTERIVPVCLHTTTPIGVPSKSCTTHFDRQLSLAIDLAHDTLNALAGRRGLRAWWWRFCVRRQLRKLEAMVPR